MANTKLPARLLDTSAIPALNVTGDLTVDTTTLKVDSTNNRVGIGVASPSANLHISGGAPTRLLIEMDGDTAGAEAQLQFKVDSQDNDSRIKAAIIFRRDDPGTRGTGNLHFAVNGDNNDVSATTAHSRMMIQSDGKVGIGVALPSAKFNVVGDSGTAVVESIRNPSTSWSEYALTRYGTEGSDVRYMDFGYYRGASEGTRGLVIKSQADATLVTFLDSGNVGIGTNNPSSPLHVSAAKNDGWLAQLINTGTGGDANGLDIHAGVDSSDYILRTREQDGTDVMVVKYGGQVGIGTNNPGWPLDVSTATGSVQLQLGRTGGNAGTAWLGADAGGFHLGVGAYGSGNSVATPNGLEVRTDGAIYMGDRAANIAQLNIGTQGKASGMEFYPYSSVGTTYSSWDLNLGANISPKLGTTNSGHQIMTAYTASGGSNLRVGFNQLAWQRWTPAELNGKAAHADVISKDVDPMFQVTTDGHMRAPYSSAFRTYLSTERTTNGVINSGWTDTSSSGVNAYDRAGDFNTSNGRFTAPVDGVYHFDVMWDSNASQGGISLHVTGTGHTEYNVRWEPTGRTDNVWESRAYATSVQMDTGDYVELYAVHCTGSNPIHMGSGHWGFFAGHLVS